MNLADATNLLDYNYWARDRVLAAVDPLSAEQYDRDMENSFRSIRDTLVHIHSAEWIWHLRWVGGTPTKMLAAEDYPTAAALREAWKAHEPKVRAVVEELGEAGLTRVTHYTTTTGLKCASAFWQMLQHVVNHGAYHRGQVTTMLRQLGAPPPQPLDLIAFYRERGG